MKVADVAYYRPLIGSAISHDGRWVAAVSPRYVKERDARPLAMLLRDLTADAWTDLTQTTGRPILTSPAFSADSQRLGALASGPGGPEALVITLATGAIQALPSPPSGASALKWRGPEGSPTCLGADSDEVRRVYAWPASDRPAAPLTPPGQHAGDYAFDPAGERLAWLPLPELSTPESERLDVCVQSNAGPSRLRVPGRPVGYLSWAPDGSWLAYLARRRGQRLSASELWVVDPERWPGAGAAICVTRELPGWITGYDWLPDASGFLVAVAQGTYGRLFRVALDGTATPVGQTRGYLSGPHVDRATGRYLFLDQDGDRPQRLRTGELGGHRPPRTLTRLNRRLDKRELAAPETVTWIATDGTALDGVVLRPPAADGPSPLLVWVHGGPAEHIARTFSPYFQVFANAGYAVFAPNYRGSTGRDEAFLRANVGDLGGADVQDVLTGIDRVTQMGIADPALVGAVGWSYGGTLALRMAQRTDLIRALVVGAPVVDWVSFFGAPRLPALSMEYFSDPPWRDRAPFDRASPISDLANLQTPTLVVHGGLDAVVPPSQGRLLYRALKASGVTSDFMLYPEEGHVPTRPSAVADMLQRIIGWLGDHLGVGSRSDA